jgi:ribosomal 30S subunit maturation factor RimM
LSADPVSWLVIEQGWQVVDASGQEVGKVASVTGDANADIFDGLEVKTGLLETRYVPAEQVASIVQGEVRLT